MRFFNKRTLFLVGCVLALIVISAITGVFVYFSSPGFKETARQYLVQEIEKESGGRATLGRVHWNLWTRRVSLLDLTVHGTEADGTAPLLHIESIDAGFSLRSLLKRRIDLFELTVSRPEIHMSIDSKGNTNLPSPPPHDATGRTDFQLSIGNFKVAQGMAFVNERQIALDFVMRNVNSNLDYQGLTRILSARVTYDGVLERAEQASIPYSFDSDLDFTRGTLLLKHVAISTGKSKIQLQGRINDVLTSSIAGKLEYSGNSALSFMNYFFPMATLSGNATLAGTLEFSRDAFQTRGNVKSENAGFSRWNATAVRADYDYRFPEKRFVVNHFSTGIFGGSAEGKLAVDNVPGPSRVTINLSYKDLDSIAMAHEFPWDPKYRVESRMTGSLQGWFEGPLDRFEFSGDAALAAAIQKPDAGVISLPLDGSVSFVVRPKMASVANANFHFLSTSIQAEGPIEADILNLKVHMASSDLKNLSFLYADANGTGSFDGVLTGPVKSPMVEGSFDIQGHRYREWTIQQASGMARLDTLANTATLSNVRVVQGQSQITLTGTSALDGSKVDLRIQAPRVRAEDVTPFVKQPFGGVLSGAIHLTSLNPLRFDGDVRGSGLAFKDQTLQDAQSHVLYDAPRLTLQNLTASDNGSTLSGNATYNITNEAMTFVIDVDSIDLYRLRRFGLPDAVEGMIQHAHLTGGGTPQHPTVDGNARLQNLAFHGETFPTARVDVKSTGSQVELKLSETQNLKLTATIDTVKNGYPFNAQAAFTSYSIERLAGFKRGTLIVSGDATLEGSLNDLAHVKGEGHIDPMELGIQDQTLRSTKPFAFDFNSERLNLPNEVSVVSGTGTQLVMKGTVGLTEKAKLDLTVKGQVDAGLLASDASWKIGGPVALNCQIGGTVADPDLRGQASFSDVFISRQGLTTSITGLKGDVLFDEHRLSLNNVEGHASGGNISLHGTGTIEGNTIGALNLQIMANGVRLRYPTGMRSVVDGTLALSGSLAMPSLSGELQIQNLTFNSSFDEFLALFDTAGSAASGSPFGNLQLSLRVTGNRNISISNELAKAEARVDLGIKGTLDNPALTGHVETSSGTLLFQGKKYDVTRGNIDFVNPVRIDPTINIQAETTVRNYQVYLSISGRMNHLLLNMRSEPPLPQLEIVNLMTGSKTTDELGLAKAGATPTGEQVFQGGAASILSDMLVSRVGSKFNLMGLDRIVRIDPFVVGAENTTRARITLSDQLTKDLSVTYSQELASNKQQIIEIEYFITKNISILASKDENDVRALDLRIRRRF